MSGGFWLRTTGQVPCITTGAIDGVAVLDGHGQNVPTPIEGPGGPPPSSALLLPDVAFPDVPFPVIGSAPMPGIGSVALLWSNWCTPTLTLPLSLQVKLGAGVERTVPIDGGVPHCDYPQRPSLLTVFPVNVSPASLAPSPTPTLPPGVSPTPDWGVDPPLGISNGTTLTVTLILTGKVIGTYPPGSGRSPLVIPNLPPLPWVVEARSPSGRLLTSMTVAAGELYETTTPNGGRTENGTLGRVDLSCGRLDINAGAPASGPAPGPGKPGDCAP